MISALAVACFLLVRSWLPVPVHERLSRITGVGIARPLDQRLLERRAEKRARTRGQVQTARLLQSLIGELTAGITTPLAFSHVLGPACTGPSSLTEIPPTADTQIWQDVAHVWRASDVAGFSMSVALQRIHAQALVDQEVAREVQGNAAAPRFAMLTIACLPVMAWVGAGATGAKPVDFLLHTPLGWICAIVGGLLFGAAAWWMRALTRRALA